MPWLFGDGFDTYSATTDPYMGGTYWDSGNGANFTLVTGRFSGSRAITLSLTSGTLLTKSSGANESVHHFNVGFQQTTAFSGTSNVGSIQIIDGTTTQCSIVFRSTGDINLTSGGPTGTVLATYAAGVGAPATWYGFEFEVVVHNTAGSFTVRRNGNTSNDFSLGSLNTRVSANNYANKVTLGVNSAAFTQNLDDFLWRSDPSSLPWVGDIRCYTRMPASDAAVQWTPSAAALPQPVAVQAVSSTFNAGQSRYVPFTPLGSGAISTVTLPITVASTANIKCALYSSSAGLPGTVLGSATPVAAPGIGTATFTFSTSVSVTIGTQYFVAFCPDATSGQFGSNNATTNYFLSGTYVAFPANNPATTSTTTNCPAATVLIGGTSNSAYVAEPQQDAANSYVASSTVGQADLYGIAPITATPSSVVAVVSRALAQKTDAGTRNISLDVKSGSTTSAGASSALNTSFGYVWRVDRTDPATGAAWTAVAVNNMQLGCKVTA